MAGPNPYRVHSFEELRYFGRTWLVCEPCRRFAIVPASRLKGRDTRTTTFSCSVCGGPSKIINEDPGIGGRLQFDPRENPQHHPEATLRLRLNAELARMGLERRHGKIAREDLPQARLERPKPLPTPTYKPKPFPVQTFGDIAAWGLEVKVQCSSCHHKTPLDIGENLKALPMLGTRLRCTRIIPGNAAAPDRVCGGRGSLYMSPSDQQGVVPHERFVEVLCFHFDHPAGFVASYLVLDRPPWQHALGRHEKFTCPGCHRIMRHTWHAADQRSR